MSRVLLTGSVAHQKSAVEALHRTGSLHISDYIEQYEGFRIGTPMAGAAAHSEKLLKLRAASKALGMEKEGAPSGMRSSRWARERLDRLIAALEREVASREIIRRELEGSLRALEKSREACLPFADLPLPFEAFRPYDSLGVFTGTAGSPFEEELQRISGRYLLFWPRPDGLLALFIEKGGAAGAEKALARHGFSAVHVPFEKGFPGEVLSGIEKEIAATRNKLEQLRSELALARRSHREEILACSEELAVEIERAESPLRFATTQSAFVIEGWIPTDELDATENALLKATSDRVYMERLDELEWAGDCALARGGSPGKQAAARGGEEGASPGGPQGQNTTVPPAEAPSVIRGGMRRAGDGGQGPAEGAEAGGPGTENDPYECVPISLAHPGPVRPFEMLTEMFALPSYKEIDPTSILALVFPFFFGLMIGDLGYGALLFITGMLLRWKLRKWEGFAEIGWYIMVAGAIAALFGVFVFGEAFGIPFHAAQTGEKAGELSWYSLAGIDLPFRALVHKLESSGLSTLMIFSVLAGIVHLSLGNILGMINSWRHSRRHAAGKLGWLLVVLGFGLLVLKVGEKNALGMWVWSGLPAALSAALDTGMGILVPYSSVCLLAAGIALAVAGEGGNALLEVMGSLSNLLSYTRLAAIGVAKAAMAFAFNSMLIPLVVGGDLALAVLGWAFLVMAHFLVFVLGALSAGIQALRLNLVEFFMRFYKGGGIKFKPFGYLRRYTTE